MDESVRAAWIARGLVLVWTFLGAVVVAAFFIAAFFTAFSPIVVGDPGVILLLVPLLTGFILGVVLTDAEIVVAAGAGVLCATFAALLVGLFLFSPVIAGVAQTSQPFAAFSIASIALSVVMVFPLVVVGSVVGRGVGDIFLPTPRLRRQLEQLREETRRWHEALERLERRQQEEPRQPDVSPGSERKD